MCFPYVVGQSTFAGIRALTAITFKFFLLASMNILLVSLSSVFIFADFLAKCTRSVVKHDTKFNSGLVIFETDH